MSDAFEKLMETAKKIRAMAANESYQRDCRSGGEVPPPDRYDYYYEQVYSDIEPALEPYLRMPNPTAYDALIQRIKDAMELLNTREAAFETALTRGVHTTSDSLDRLSTAGGFLSEWTGEAAIAFKANYIDGFKTKVGYDFTALSTMKGAFEAHKAMWEAARKDIVTIAHNTMVTLQHYSEPSKNDAKFYYAVLSAIGTVSAAVITVLTGGATAPIVGIGAAASIGAASESSSSSTSTEATVGGSSPEAIIRSMLKEIDNLRHHIQTVEADAAKKLGLLEDGVYKNKDKLVPARPRLADMSDRDLYGRSGMGRT
ncbi:hypothetical protein [Nocardia brasiliensis]|nr:hypothetical protein [Nocardia brasiliensis]